MKRYFLLSALVAILSWMTTETVSAKSKVQKVYIFGFAASFNDSTVYFTDIQEIDSAWVDDKTHFLHDRDQYSYQLRDYLAEKFEPNRTCITTFALSRKDIEKKYVKMKERYTREKFAKKHGRFDVKYLTTADFRYTAVTPTFIDDETPLTKEEQKAQKKAAKEAEKAKKAEAAKKRKVEKALEKQGA